MAEALGIQSAQQRVQSGVPGASTGAATQAAEAAAKIPGAPSTDVQQPVRAPEAGATTWSSESTLTAPIQSKVVQRLLEQNARVYGPGLAQIPLPARPEGVPRTTPRKPAGPMVAPRSLEGGRSPLAPDAVYDARSSADAIGRRPDSGGEANVLADAGEGAWRMPSRHGLVAYTTNARGDRVYLTQERWLHIRENHMDAAPQPRGKRTTTFWPTRHAVESPSMTDQDVIGVIVDAARRGALRTEVRDTRMSEYDLPADEAAAYGVTEAKVSMAPDGLVLSAYPGAGPNVLAVYEMSEADQAELARAQAMSYSAEVESTERDDRLFRTNVASTTFG